MNMAVFVEKELFRAQIEIGDQSFELFAIVIHLAFTNVEQIIVQVVVSPIKFDKQFLE